MDWHLTWSAKAIYQGLWAPLSLAWPVGSGGNVDGPCGAAVHEASPPTITATAHMRSDIHES